MPTSISSIGGLPKNDVGAHKETPKDSAGLYNNLVEGKKDEDKSGARHNWRDDMAIAVDSTGIKVTNRGEWIVDK